MNKWTFLKKMTQESYESAKSKNGEMYIGLAEGLREVLYTMDRLEQLNGIPWTDNEEEP